MIDAFLYLFKMMIFQFATLVPPKIWRVSVVWLILTRCLWKPKPTLLQGWDLIQSPLVKNAEIYTHETWNLGKQGQTTFEYENTNMDMFIIQLLQRFSRETLLIFVNTFQVKGWPGPPLITGGHEPRAESQAVADTSAASTDKGCGLHCRCLGTNGLKYCWKMLERDIQKSYIL